MKAAGLLMLFAGFAIVLSAFVLLSTRQPRIPFVLAGVAVQLIGLGLTFRSHVALDEEQ